MLCYNLCLKLDNNSIESFLLIPWLTRPDSCFPILASRFLTACADPKFIIFDRANLETGSRTLHYRFKKALSGNKLVRISLG